MRLLSPFDRSFNLTQPEPRLFRTHQYCRACSICNAASKQITPIPIEVPTAVHGIACVASGEALPIARKKSKEDGTPMLNGRAVMPGIKTLVASLTLRQQDHPGVTVGEGIESTLKSLKQWRLAVWQSGGNSGCYPVLPESGTPLLPPPGSRLRLTNWLVSLEYAIG